jgi:S-adenosylmethionine-diacylglycerol 3-amino-3-carboxypropyl transferase
MEPGHATDEDRQLASEVDFTIIRYAQCWEDADVLVEALDVKPGDVCLSIASAGDNSLSLLTKSPAKVVAIDLSPSQLACLELRVAAYRLLSHKELLELMGARPSRRRHSLYARLAPELGQVSRRIWDAQGRKIEQGIGAAGKFERYLDLIRRFTVNVTHSKRVRDELFISKPLEKRRDFYARRWANRRWRALIRLACTRPVMGRLGRDPRFFKYADDTVADHILELARHAMVDLDPADNPYLHWIVRRCYGECLPHALREENFPAIRANLERLEWHRIGLHEYLDRAGDASIDRFNLSDVFEYLSEDESNGVFERIAEVGRSGGRLAYWNMLVPRCRPDYLADRIRPLPDLSSRLHAKARTFFYNDFVVEEIA